MVPFHIHSDHSLLHSPLKIKELIAEAKTRGFDTLGIAELNNMFSTIEFYETCKKNEIKPIIGSDVLIKREGIYSRIVLIALDKHGYDNLMYLSSISYLYHLEGSRPVIPYEELIKHQEGVGVILSMLESEIGKQLNILDEKNALNKLGGEKKAKKIIAIYKKDIKNIYLEIRKDSFEEKFLIDGFYNFAIENNIPPIASANIFYLNKTDIYYKDALECIESNKLYDDMHRDIKIGEFYLKTKKEYEKAFENYPKALQNNIDLFKNIDLTIPLGNPTPPTFKFTKEYAKKEGIEIKNDVEYFEYKCHQGLEKKLKKIPPELHEKYKKRLEYEINIIEQMKFPGYMLIVWDFINYAKDPSRHLRPTGFKIPVGPGRGSAAGSLVAYSLEITNLDPLKYNLLFERFLNPQRVSMPDIDVDICQARRDEVIEYVQKKYGYENVAQVVTFGSLLAKGVLRDIARIFGIDYSTADKFVKLIPDQLGITLAKAKEMESKIAQITTEDRTYERMYSFGEKLEGIKRNTGKHAAGVVISDEPLWKKSPLYRPDVNEKMHTTQYSLNYLEPVDLIKFDFLGLKTLTVIDQAVKNIKMNQNKDINIDELSLDDKNVFELIQSGKTLGLFQIESNGMQDLAKRLKPNTFEDIIAMLALYRPGPMDSGMLDDYIYRKHGKKEINYFFDEFEEALKPILKPTYGVIVYQEQVMQIVQAIGGFSLGKADIIRRAMGKKKKDVMIKYSKEFVAGAKKQGFSQTNAKALFELIEKFAGYGFNKSHSAAYAMITYQTAWLKKYYPAEFFAALLTYEADNMEKIAKYIEEAKTLGINVLPPNVQKSNHEFTPVENKILFGLSAIKGIGAKAIESIVADRPFKNLEDFILKIDSSKVNKKVLEQLIKSGAMDSFGYTRKTLLQNLEDILEFKKRIEDRKNALNNPNSLFANLEQEEDEHLNIYKRDEFDMKTLLNGEYETLGFYVSAHPLDPYKNKIKHLKYNLSSEIDDILGQEALFVGKIESVKVRISKKGNKFAIVSLMDFHGKIDLMVFERDLKKLQELNTEEPVAFKAKVEKLGEFLRITSRKVMSLEEAKKEKAAVIDEIVTVEQEIGENYEKDLLEIYNHITKCPGNKRVNLVLKTPFGFSLEIKTNLRCNL